MTEETPIIRTFADAVDLYVDNLLARGTLSKGYNAMVRQLARNYGALSLDAVPGALMASRRAMAKTHSNHLINRHTTMIRAVYNRLIALELIVKNPITTAKFPKYKEKPRDRYLDQSERERLLTAIREHNPHILPIVQYMMVVPCRTGELVLAKREQYNPYTNTVYIPDSKSGLPIHKPVPDNLVDYFRSIPVGCLYLFYKVRENGRYQPITKQVLKRAWAACLKLAGIADLRIHDLRHVAATDLYEVGNPEREIMDIAGWRTPMLSRYRHKDSLRSAQKIRFKSV
ncbi:MAG: site-specific integrase [Chitinispirillia bacterium]|nr:site-specific integrase [Chitinispirillia bacterium]